MISGADREAEFNLCPIFPQKKVLRWESINAWNEGKPLLASIVNYSNVFHS